MFFLKAAYCRIFQGAFRMALPLLPYREPEILPSVKMVPDLMNKENLKKPLIVTDKGIVKNGLVEPLQAALQEKGIAYSVYDETEPNPSVKNVEAALEMYIAGGCDCIVAIGGGSAMDCAKAVGARVACPRRSIRQMKGVLRVLRSIPTLIAIPTTAGTGSEVTLAAVITDGQDKYALMSFPLIPRYAALDASLTVSLPPHLTASTGMDALTHAVEAYIGRSTTRKTRKLALEAAKLIFENIETAFRDGGCLAARENMLHAAYKAGAAFSQSYVGYIHAAAHSLGGKYGIAHGLANAVIMPCVLDMYGKSAEKKLHRMAVATGVCGADTPREKGAEMFISAIRGLNARMGLPEKLPGIAQADIPELAAHAEKEANPLYPVPKLMTAKELEKIFYTVMDKSEGK